MLCTTVSTLASAITKLVQTHKKRDTRSRDTIVCFQACTQPYQPLYILPCVFGFDIIATIHERLRTHFTFSYTDLAFGWNTEVDLLNTRAQEFYVVAIQRCWPSVKVWGSRYSIERKTLQRGKKERRTTQTRATS